MAVFNKFSTFVESLAEKVFNLQSDTLKVLLTNTQPVAGNAVRADLVEIAAGNGYVAGGAQATVSNSAQAGGTYKLVLADVVFTAVGGPFPTARYAVLYDDTPTAPADPLIGWWDYGSSFALAAGETLTVDFDDADGVLTIA